MKVHVLTNLSGTDAAGTVNTSSLWDSWEPKTEGRGRQRNSVEIKKDVFWKCAVWTSAGSSSGEATRWLSRHHVREAYWNGLVRDTSASISQMWDKGPSAGQQSCEVSRVTRMGNRDTPESTVPVSPPPLGLVISCLRAQTDASRTRAERSAPLQEKTRSQLL